MQRREKITQLLWYIVIGILTYLLNNFLLFIFRKKIFLGDSASVMLAFLITALCHFILHNTITFRKSTRNFKAKFTGHAIVTVLNYFAGSATAVLVLKFIIDSNWIATACSTFVTFCLGYGLFSKFVYKTA